MYITCGKIQKFIEQELPNYLNKECKKFNLLYEGDVECVTYYYLRKFLDENRANNWQMRVRWTIKRRTGKRFRIPDITLLRDGAPKIFIEIKGLWHTFPKQAVGSIVNDLAILTRKYELRKGYLIFVIRRPYNEVTGKLNNMSIPKEVKVIPVCPFVSDDEVKNFEKKEKQFYQKFGW